MNDIREAVSQANHPLATDPTDFGKWLRCQVHRQDSVGALARVAAQDPYWPGGTSRMVVRNYFMNMGAREFVLDSVKASWDEFEKQQQKMRTTKRRKAEKAARQKQQQMNRRRRGKR